MWRRDIANKRLTFIALVALWCYVLYLMYPQCGVVKHWEHFKIKCVKSLSYFGDKFKEICTQETNNTFSKDSAATELPLYTATDARNSSKHNPSGDTSSDLMKLYDLVKLIRIF